MTKSGQLDDYQEWDYFRRGVENSHRMMTTNPALVIESIPVEPSYYPCIAFAATAFKTKERMTIGYMFCYKDDFVKYE